ncbi:MAG: DUF4349 domain-containing protein [Solirubrobacterales bacterium]|nr:DUF4349 domain-containing protein [Solirubrobacterales bacterium]
MFDLLIPSGKLGDALAGFSGIAEVQSRSESTADITAPTVATGERLRDARARVEGLLAQLSRADSEAERSAVEAELRAERRRLARLRSRLGALQRRAHLSRVSLRIESGAAPSRGAGLGGRWGVGDALGDAGQILGTAAAVSVVGLAILVPLGLILLLVWLARRSSGCAGVETAPSAKPQSTEIGETLGFAGRVGGRFPLTRVVVLPGWREVAPGEGVRSQEAIEIGGFRLRS